MKTKYQSVNHDPTMEVMARAISTLTKDMTPEQLQAFSKSCFDEVAQIRYLKYAKYPSMNITITHQ